MLTQRGKWSPDLTITFEGTSVIPELSWGPDTYLEIMCLPGHFSTGVED